MSRLYCGIALTLLFVAGGIVGSGCSDGEVAEAECRADHECGDDEICDVALGICEQPRGTGGNDTDDNDDNDSGASNDGNNFQANDSEDNDSEQFNSITPPSNDETPSNDGEDDQNDGGDQNDDQSGPTGGCSEEFEDCDPDGADQGGLVCVENDDGSGTCMSECDQAGMAADCAAEQYCWEYNDAGDASCHLSECSIDSDCTDGTCVKLDNSYGTCFDDGPGLKGDPCVGGDAGECAEGLICDGSDGDLGQCRSTCEPWGLSPCDGFGEVCTVYWTRTGLCTDDITYSGISTYDSCYPAGAWCDDAVECRSGADQNYCLEYCRPGMGDCPALGDGSSAVCDEYFFYGIESVGMCMPACDFDSDCGDEHECVDDICRRPCTDAAIDCCAADDPDCSAKCSSAGYCK